MTNEELDRIKRRCYQLDDPRITEPERFVHQLLAEVRLLEEENERLKGQLAELIISRRPLTQREYERRAELVPDDSSEI